MRSDFSLILLAKMQLPRAGRGR